MLTPQEIQEKRFAKAVFGGYDMGEVDAFLDQLFADYENLFKDTAVLKSKLKTLAEKIEEYRSVDEEMRSTLAAAKRTAGEMKSEAEKYAAETRAEADRYAASVRGEADRYASETGDNAKREAERLVERARAESDGAIAKARAEAEEKIGDIRAKIGEEQKRLEDARAESRRFAADAVALNRRQLDVLRRLMEMSPKKEQDAAVAAWSESAVGPEPEEERITVRHAEDNAAEAAAIAADKKENDAGWINEPTKRLPVTEQPARHLDAVRRVDVGGETVEIGDTGDGQDEEDELQRLFGGDGKNGE